MLEKIDKTFREVTGKRLDNVSLLKLFDILQDIEKTKIWNIFKTYDLNSDLSKEIYYVLHEVGHDEWWENISYEYYDTPYLWWAVALMNDCVNPYEELEIGTSLKILNPEYIYQLLKEIKQIGSL